MERDCGSEKGFLCCVKIVFSLCLFTSALANSAMCISNTLLLLYTYNVCAIVCLKLGHTHLELEGDGVDGNDGSSSEVLQCSSEEGLGEEES